MKLAAIAQHLAQVVTHARAPRAMHRFDEFAAVGIDGLVAARHRIRVPRRDEPRLRADPELGEEQRKVAHAGVRRQRFVVAHAADAAAVHQIEPMVGAQYVAEVQIVLNHAVCVQARQHRHGLRQIRLVGGRRVLEKLEQQRFAAAHHRAAPYDLRRGDSGSHERRVTALFPLAFHQGPRPDEEFCEYRASVGDRPRNDPATRKNPQHRVAVQRDRSGGGDQRHVKCLGQRAPEPSEFRSLQQHLETASTAGRINHRTHSAHSGPLPGPCAHPCDTTRWPAAARATRSGRSPAARRAAAVLRTRG